MDWFYGLKIRNKLLIPILTISLLMIGMGTFALQKFEEFDQNVKLLTSVNLKSNNLLLQGDTDVYRVMAEERSMLFLNPTSPEFEESVKHHQSSLKDAHNKLDQFYKLMQDPTLEEAYQTFKTEREKWEIQTNTVVSARQSNTREGRTTAIEVSFKDGNDAFIAMRSAIQNLQELLDVRAAHLMESSHNSVQKSYYWVSIFIGVGLVIIIIMILLIPKLIVDPIFYMQNYIRSLAGGGGDLTHKIPVHYQDELGQLGQTINEFIDSLRGLIARVINMGEMCNEQALTLNQLANKNSVLVQSETQEISQVASAISQLSNSVQEVARLAVNAAQRTQDASEASRNGLSVVNSTINAISQLAKEVENSSDVITKLNADSTNIINVVKVIKGIAEQINLLALNAAIEAARAGEQGRGFAVVADSVRELAFRTAESTQEIQDMISTLQKSANSAVAAMHNSQAIALDSVHQAGATGDALTSINKAVNMMSQVNKQISEATDEQSSVAGEVSENTRNISRYATDAADLSKNVASSSAELAKIAGLLRKELFKFRV